MVDQKLTKPGTEGVAVTFEGAPVRMNYAGQVNLDNKGAIGTFPNGDPWPAWAWQDWHAYANVFFDEKNDRVDPLLVKIDLKR